MSEISVKAVEKEIDYQISVKNNFWNATVLSIGGTLGLLFAQIGIVKYLFVFTGALFSYIFLKGYFTRSTIIECLIKKINLKEAN